MRCLNVFLLIVVSVVVTSLLTSLVTVALIKEMQLIGANINESKEIQLNVVMVLSGGSSDFVLKPKQKGYVSHAKSKDLYISAPYVTTSSIRPKAAQMMNQICSGYARTITRRRPLRKEREGANEVISASYSF